MAIRDLSKKLSNKPSREEIDNYLKFKPNSDEIFKALNNLMTMRKEMSLEDAISMSGFDREDFITGKYIKLPIKEINMTLKKRYCLE